MEALRTFRSGAEAAAHRRARSIGEGSRRAHRTAGRTQKTPGRRLLQRLRPRPSLPPLPEAVRDRCKQAMAQLQPAFAEAGTAGNSRREQDLFKRNHRYLINLMRGSSGVRWPDAAQHRDESTSHQSPLCNCQARIADSGLGQIRLSRPAIPGGGGSRPKR